MIRLFCIGRKKEERRKIKWQNGIWIVRNSVLHEFCFWFWFSFSCDVNGQTDNKINDNQKFSSFLAFYFFVLAVSTEIMVFSIYRQRVQRTFFSLSPRRWKDIMKRRQETEEARRPMRIHYFFTMLMPYRTHEKNVFIIDMMNFILREYCQFELSCW